MGEPGPREGAREEAAWRPGSWQWRSGRGAGAERWRRAERGSARGGIPKPGACPACALRSPSPRALRFLSPSSLRAQGKERSSPSPGELRQGPLVVAVLATAGAGEGSLRVETPFSWRRWGSASSPQRRLPSSKGKKLASPYGRASPAKLVPERV